MGRPKRRHPPTQFNVTGSIVEDGTALRWWPVRGAKSYFIEWMNESKEWRIIDEIKNDARTRDARGLIQHVDPCYDWSAPGGTYRVTACFDTSIGGRQLISTPVTVTAPTPARSTRNQIAQRLKGKRMRHGIKALIRRFRWGPHGWKALLPESTGRFLGKRIEVRVGGQQLSDTTLSLLESIFARLPKLAARADKAMKEDGGLNMLLEGQRLTRPRIVIDPGRRPAGAWTMIIEVKGSDYAWHVEFVRSRFKEIWSGD